MPNTAKVEFNIKNFTTGVSTPLPGIMYVEGLTKRGPIEQPELFLINSWAKYERIYGGLTGTSDFPLLCKRALVRGATLRVSRVDAVSTAAVKAPAENVQNADGTAVTLFTIRPKYAGADYNNISFEIKAASNAQTAYWDLSIVHDLEPDLNEYYANIPAFVVGDANAQSALDEVMNMTQLIDFVYSDASTATLLVPAVAAANNFAGGVDPAGHVAGDYTAAMASFNDVDDGMIMAVPEMDDDGVNSAGITYAAGRKDLVFFAHLGNDLTTAANLIAERVTVASDSKHGAFFAGGIRVRDEVTLQEKVISEMGDVLGIAAYVHDLYGEWYSLAGQKKGFVPDALGVVNNFGTPAGFADLNLLANSQINMMVVKNNITQLSGNFSGQYTNNQEKFLSIVFLVLWMKNVLKPILEEYLEEPNDPVTFKAIYYHLKPLLDSLASPAKRALYKYEYYGDQEANTLDDLQINDPVDVQNGKYKINLKIWAIPSLQELEFNLMLVQGEGVTIQ